MKSVIDKALEDHSNQKARPVIHKQLDKSPVHGLLHYLGLTHTFHPEFSEVMCSFLCVPSPACRDLVGSKIGRGRVDIWGDKVQSSILPGDLFRHKHDRVKIKL